MHPDRHDLVPHRALRLRDLALVVRELVVVAAGVDVEALAEVLHRHRRALDVPAREAIAPRGGPFQGAMVAGRLPQREVLRMALVRVGDRLPCRAARRACRACCRRASRSRGTSRRRSRRCRSATYAWPRLDQALDDGDHLGDVLGRPRVEVGALDPQEVRVLQERSCTSPRSPSRRGPRGFGELHLVPAGVRDLVGHVSDVGDVHDPADVEALVPERAAQRVGQHERAHVADVDVPVHGRPAGVDLHGSSIDRDDVRELARQ